MERELSEVLRQFAIARSVTAPYSAEAAFAVPSVAVSAKCGVKSIMGVEVPDIELITSKRS